MKLVEPHTKEEFWNHIVLLSIKAVILKVLLVDIVTWKKRLMTGKPRERLHVVHLRCWRCNRYHYNTCNLGTVVIITTLYPNDPLEE